MDKNCNPINCNIPQSECQKQMIIVLNKSIKQDLIKDINNCKENIKSNYNFSKFLFDFTQIIFAIWLTVTWMAGFVLAKGFWSTFFCIIPFYAWYLVVEAYLSKYGLL